jgi:methionyl-tRNA synthetase
LCKEAPYGGELAFSEDSMRDMHNADLCDNVGNLVHRATSLCGRYCDGVVPDIPAPLDLKPVSDLGKIIDAYAAKMNAFELQGGAFTAIEGFRGINAYLQEAAPWKLKGEEYVEQRKMIVRATLEAIYALTHLLLPFTPVGAAKIFRKLHTEPVSLSELKRDCRNLTVGTKIDVGDVLYEKSLSEEERRDAAAAAAKKKESHAEAQRRKREAKQKAIEKSKQAQVAGGDPDQPDFTKLDIRVGKIVEVWPHEAADTLFCEKIDVGEESGPREIASGLRDFYTAEQMRGRKVLVVCNLKAAKIVGFTSNGMVLAAKGEDGSTVELIEPPADAPIGERVFIDGLTGDPLSPAQVKKKKVFEDVAKTLKTGQGGVAQWDGKDIVTSAGPCRAASLVGAPIS